MFIENLWNNRAYLDTCNARRITEDSIPVGYAKDFRIMQNKEANENVYEMVLPGFREENISITLNNDKSAINVRASKGESGYAENKQYNFTLTRGEKIYKTSLENGVLKIYTKIEKLEQNEEIIPIGFNGSKVKQVLKG
jgi:HSP20 family molecular chaperone IbpA